MRRAILLLGILGTLLFGAAFAVSFVDPLLVERGARELIRIEVERKVGEKVDALSRSKIVTMAQKALGKTDAEIEAARQELAQGIPAKVVNVVANMLHANCECRKRLVEAANRAHEERTTSLGHVRERLVGLIETAYASVSAHLLREFRIFTASNAMVFACLALVAYWRKAAALQLILPAMVLLGAVAITGGLYLFEQNWLHTILYSDYVGLAYLAYLGAAVCFLGDVVFNRARVSTMLVNAGLSVVGAAFTALPC
jgi:hypothetical protein